jgi:hypothetical protein
VLQTADSISSVDSAATSWATTTLSAISTTLSSGLSDILTSSAVHIVVQSQSISVSDAGDGIVSNSTASAVAAPAGDSGPLSTGAIIGIGAGCAALALVVVVAGILVACRRRNPSHPSPPHSMSSSHMSAGDQEMPSARESPGVYGPVSALARSNSSPTNLYGAAPSIAGSAEYSTVASFSTGARSTYSALTAAELADSSRQAPSTGGGVYSSLTRDEVG